jgi:hypothetical protein
MTTQRLLWAVQRRTMAIQVQKAGGAAAPAAAAGTMKGTAAEATTVLRPPRAVSAEEAPSIQPARQSTAKSMMPWRGWFDRFLKEKVFTAEQYERYRTTFFFMPDDIYDLQQSPMPSKKIPISRTDPSITHMYRHPAPGSQEPAREPQFEADEDPYDTGYFKRDTRRRYLGEEQQDPVVARARLAMMDPDDPNVQEEIAKLEAGPESSPGNQGRFATGPTDFDPSGLRATMSVTWKELDKSLDKHMPNHLPEPVWVGHEEEIKEWYESRDIPCPIGGYYQPLKVPRERRIAKW